MSSLSLHQRKNANIRADIYVGSACVGEQSYSLRNQQLLRFTGLTHDIKKFRVHAVLRLVFEKRHDPSLAQGKGPLWFDSTLI